MAVIVEFRCDFCGKKIEREDVTALILIDGAFLPGADKQEMQLELCRRCANMIRRTRDSNPAAHSVVFREVKGKGKILQGNRDEL